MTADYAQKLTAGLEYQDFIMERLHLIGTILQPYSSKAGQRRGENMYGMEIKFDRKFKTTGNLCIEVCEKAKDRPGDYVPSGICRSDNTWLYGIGDYQIFWIFAKSTLRTANARRSALMLRGYETPTSKGFLIPTAFAEKCYARKVSFNFDGGIKSVEVGGEVTPIDVTAIPKPTDFQLRLLP